MRHQKKGFDFVNQNFADRYTKKFERKAQSSIFISGAEAVALGAIRAGVKFAAIYPMTPINGIMAKITEHALEYNIIIKEPEDELAGINMAIGSSYAGARSMVATAGGGFSLMAEALGLAAQTEVPLVVVEGMRPGPATGMPTWSDQGDLRFVLHAAQGEFPRIVMAPGDLHESFTMTMEAFNLADKYQLPVIILGDKYLFEGRGTVSLNEVKTNLEQYKIDRGKLIDDEILRGEKDYKRYSLAEDGVSPRSLPGQEGGISLTGSDEHDERGLYNEESHMRIAMMDKRFKKLEVASHETLQPQLIGDSEAGLTLVIFGSTKLPALEAINWLKVEGLSANILQIPCLSPFPSVKALELLQSAKKTLVIEGNLTGQFEGLIREFTGFVPTAHLRKYDGRPFYPEEIVAKVKEML